jgi:hypothetical protein
MPFAMDWENPGFIRLRASGRLTASDYDAMEPDFHAELARRGGRAPLLLDVRGWRGWTAGGLVRDLRFDIRHRNNFPRIAVVGDRPWHKWLTYAAKPVFSGEMRYFDAAREAEAISFATAAAS